MPPLFILAASSLSWGEPAFAAHCPSGQLWRVHLGECVNLSSPLARPYIGTRKSAGAIAVIHASKLEAKTTMAPVLASKVEEETDIAPAADPPPPVQAPAANPPDDPPDEVDMAAWFLMPLLQAVEARWADLVKPPPLLLRAPDGQNLPPWPSEGVFGSEF